jgi:leucyl aminopeptidase
MSTEWNGRNILMVDFVNNKDLNEDLAVFLINNNLHIDDSITEFDNNFNGIIVKSLNDPHFTGKIGECKMLQVLNASGDLKKILIVGVGDETALSSYSFQSIGGTIYKTSTTAKALSARVFMPKSGSIGSFKNPEIASLLATGMKLASYRFDKYQTQLTDAEKFFVANVNIALADNATAESLFQSHQGIIDGVFLARDYITEAPNVLFPESYAEKVVTAFDSLDVDIEVLGERDMRELGMGALLGVGQGSSKESKLVVIRYNGADDEDADPVCLVGKGVTFDTGGISLKPSAGMWDMKYDMSGSAAVVGTILALAKRGAKVNVVGILGLVENMPGGNAQRPGDIVKTMSGQTVEVLDTDAEGRLVLCDCLWYVQEKFKPACIIDLATLTGAVVIALGNSYAGCFSNDDNLAHQLNASGTKTNEKIWRMPLDKDFDDMLKSKVADIANIGGERGAASSSTAAHFLGRFVKKGVKWAHLDIAGMAWDKKGNNSIIPVGAVGYGVRLLNQFIQDHYESK